jgi:WD40 repeat protein
MHFSGHGDDVNAVAYADDNPNVILSGSDDAIIRIWDKRVPGNRAQGLLFGEKGGGPARDMKGL